MNTEKLGPESKSLGTWVKNCNGIQVEWKRAVARYCVSHLVKYGLRVQLGSGTTFTYIMDEIIHTQKRKRAALDLVLLTTNLTVLQKGRDAQLENADLFGSMQIILTGGALQPALHSLVGEYAAQGVRTHVITPDVVFFGAAGVHISDQGIDLAYQFEGELSTQVSYATRKTTHRVLVCDHAKIGCSGGWIADVSLNAMLKEATTFTIVSSLPPPSHPGRIRVIEQFEAFKALLKKLSSNGDFKGKNICLHLIDHEGINKMSAELTDYNTKRTSEKSSMPEKK